MIFKNTKISIFRFMYIVCKYKISTSWTLTSWQMQSMFLAQIGWEKLLRRRTWIFQFRPYYSYWYFGTFGLLFDLWRILWEWTNQHGKWRPMLEPLNPRPTLTACGPILCQSYPYTKSEKKVASYFQFSSNINFYPRKHVPHLWLVYLRSFVWWKLKLN